MKENLNNGKAFGQFEVTGEVKMSAGELVIDLVWKLCSIAFESGVVPKVKDKGPNARIVWVLVY